MIIKRKHVRKLEKNGFEDAKQKETKDSGPGYSSESYSSSYVSEKSFFTPKN